MNGDLRKWNNLIKHQDEFYHNKAKECGLADAQFWILYGLCDAEKPLSQNSFCVSWCYSKQTICTAVACLEKSGYIYLSFAEGSKKRKEINLTEKGQNFCTKHIRPLQDAEEKALSSLSEEEKNEFFRIYGLLLHNLETTEGIKKEEKL